MLSKHSSNVYSGDFVVAPGVGFDLTSSYGTAAIRYHNGSIEDVGRVVAGKDYQQMMIRLSTGSELCFSGDRILDWRSFLNWRSFRKRLGLPATPDVGLIAKVLMELRDLSESFMNYSVVAAVTSYPRIPRLCEQDISDALDYIGVKALLDRSLHHQPHELSTAYAGYGFGLCTNYTKEGMCRDQEWDLPQEQVLAVEYTKKSLGTRLKSVTQAYISYEPPNTYLIDNEAGHERSSDYPGGTEVYWDRVRLRLIELSLENGFKKNVTKVLLIGESASNETFLDVVKDAMARLQDNPPQIYHNDSLYVAARGAAEFAKRAQETRAKRMFEYTDQGL